VELRGNKKVKLPNFVRVYNFHSGMILTRSSIAVINMDDGLEPTITIGIIPTVMIPKPRKSWSKQELLPIAAHPKAKNN
jgi:hypothetical protein